MSVLNTDGRQLEVEYFQSISEMLVGFRELKLNYERRSSFTTYIDTVLEKRRSVAIFLVRIYEIGEVSVSALKFILFGGVVFLVPYLHHTENSTTFITLTLILFCLTPFEQVVSIYQAVIGALISFYRVSDLDEKLKFAGSSAPLARNPNGNFELLSLRGIIAIHESRERSDFVLGPLDFDLKKGEVVQLIGANGSGKSTFMNLLAGLHDYKTGSFTIDGKSLAAQDFESYRQRISAIFTNFHVFKRLHGLELLDGEQLVAAIERVRLQDVTGFSNGQITHMDLSAGQKRRLALAIALLEDREILILDEFVADQDPGQREYFFKTLVPLLKSKGKTLIISTHDLQWTAYCDKLYSFTNGKIAELQRESVDVT